MNNLQLVNPEEGEVTIIDASALELQTKAEIDMQISTAKKYPRDLRRAKKNTIDIATMDEETAQSCWYSLPRAGNNIEGPSVDLARILVSQYGNLRASARIVDINATHVVSQAICHDLENNVAVGIEVRRKITGKNNQRFSDDMITVTGNAANSIAFRNAVFNVIPKSLTNSALNAAKEFVAGGGDEGKFVKLRNQTIANLRSKNISDEQICLALGIDNVDNMDKEAFIRLTGIGTAIKNGDTTLEQAFPLTEKQKADAKGQVASQSTLDKLNGGKK